MAGWTLLVAERMRPRLREGDEDTRSVYGTDVADSYAAFLSGVETFRAGDSAAARRLFAKAVRFDGSNHRARLNLAVTELFDEDPAVRLLGLYRLEGLL
jgi:Flp pilus assembly protein TadD